MALESKQEKLADILSRLHQDAKEFSLIGNEQKQAISHVWANLDRDLAVANVPAQTFTASEDGTHYYCGVAFGEKWYPAVVAWLMPGRVVNVETAKPRSHIVAAIPMADDDPVLATLREIAQNMPRRSDAAVESDPFAK